MEVSSLSQMVFSSSALLPTFCCMTSFLDILYEEKNLVELQMMIFNLLSVGTSSIPGVKTSYLRKPTVRLQGLESPVCL